MTLVLWVEQLQNEMATKINGVTVYDDLST